MNSECPFLIFITFVGASHHPISQLPAMQGTSYHYPSVDESLPPSKLNSATPYPLSFIYIRGGICVFACTCVTQCCFKFVLLGL